MLGRLSVPETGLAKELRYPPRLVRRFQAEHSVANLFGCGYFRTAAKYTENQQVRLTRPYFGDGLDQGYENNPGFWFNPGVWTLPVWRDAAGWFWKVSQGGRAGFSTCGTAVLRPDTAESLRMRA